MKKLIGFLVIAMLSLFLFSWDLISAAESIKKFVTLPRGVYHNSFDHLEVGRLTREDLKKDWSDPDISKVNGLGGAAQIVRTNRGKSLQILYPKGIYGPVNSGAQWEMPRDRYEGLFVSYWVKFEKGFEFVKGGKLPGFCGGECTTGGLKPDGKGWSARMMWGPGGRVMSYIYHLRQRSVLNGCGQNGKKDCYGDGSIWTLSALETSYRFTPGKWHHVEQYVEMNTPGKANGIIRGWFDGKRAFERKDLEFRNSDEVGIDIFYFSTFFGGGDDSWAAKKDESARFDDVIISLVPIHPYIFK